MAQPIQVLYIAGSGRSGSTLLSRLLGQVEGIVNVGQAAFHYFGKCPPIPCGCGEQVEDCRFWRDIPADSELQKFGQEFFRKRHFAKFAPTNYAASTKARELIFSMGDLYRSIAEKTGAEAIVDCSKNPARAYALSRAPGVRLWVVHLIRSPYGVASSWSQAKSYLSQIPAWRAALSWNFINLFTELLAGPRLVGQWTIRYEDLIAKPRMFVEAIASAVLGRGADCSFLQGHRVTMKTQHMLAGNPDVFQGSELIIEERHAVLPSRTNLAVLAITFPLALRYGYIWPHASWLAPIRFPFNYELLKAKDAPPSSKRQIVSLPRG